MLRRAARQRERLSAMLRIRIVNRNGGRRREMVSSLLSSSILSDKGRYRIRSAREGLAANWSIRLVDPLSDGPVRNVGGETDGSDWTATVTRGTPPVRNDASRPGPGRHAPA